MNPDFFHDFSAHSIFYRFTYLRKSGNQCIFLIIPAGVFCHQYLVSVRNRYDYRRWYLRVMHRPTLGTFHHTFYLIVFQSSSTSAAELCTFIPVSQLACRDSCKCLVLGLQGAENVLLAIFILLHKLWCQHLWISKKISFCCPLILYAE